MKITNLIIPAEAISCQSFPRKRLALRHSRESGNPLFFMMDPRFRGDDKLQRGKTSIKIFLSTILLSAGLANAASPISQCTKILALSKDDFAAQISDPNQAASISETLNSCAKENACAQIDGIDDCASKLANRTFDSNVAAYENAAPSANDNAAMATAPAIISNNNTSAPTQNTNTSTYIAPLANPNAAPAPKQSINWF